jgi:hypothetical protein
MHPQTQRALEILRRLEEADHRRKFPQLEQHIEEPIDPAVVDAVVEEALRYRQERVEREEAERRAAEERRRADAVRPRVPAYGLHGTLAALQHEVASLRQAIKHSDRPRWMRVKDDVRRTTIDIPGLWGGGRFVLK